MAPRTSSTTNRKSKKTTGTSDRAKSKKPAVATIEALTDAVRAFERLYATYKATPGGEEDSEEDRVWYQALCDAGGGSSPILRLLAALKPAPTIPLVDLCNEVYLPFRAVHVDGRLYISLQERSGWAYLVVIPVAEILQGTPLK